MSASSRPCLDEETGELVSPGTDANMAHEFSTHLPGGAESDASPINSNADAHTTTATANLTSRARTLRFFDAQTIAAHESTLRLPLVPTSSASRTCDLTKTRKPFRVMKEHQARFHLGKHSTSNPPVACSVANGLAPQNDCSAAASDGHSEEETGKYSDPYDDVLIQFGIRDGWHLQKPGAQNDSDIAKVGNFDENSRTQFESDASRGGKRGDYRPETVIISKSSKSTDYEPHTEFLDSPESLWRCKVGRTKPSSFSPSENESDVCSNHRTTHTVTEKGIFRISASVAKRKPAIYDKKHVDEIGSDDQQGIMGKSVYSEVLPDSMVDITQNQLREKMATSGATVSHSKDDTAVNNSDNIHVIDQFQKEIPTVHDEMILQDLDDFGGYCPQCGHKWKTALRHEDISDGGAGSNGLTSSFTVGSSCEECDCDHGGKITELHAKMIKMCSQQKPVVKETEDDQMHGAGDTLKPGGTGTFRPTT